ncbi:amino acid transporter [Microbacterium mangrovi]|uniref:Amino acid transporter n=1 Tax=Microbacterium mangrovi TaxID=1348253 RepID=A0A0B2ACX9_9MICO|nr:APC family permease [Microbacterium mangrovi]KHK99437.1 amino acid transporter [Microbacterium mangrovi]
MTALERAIARPAPVRDFAGRSPLDGLDRRSVGFVDVLAQSVAAVAPSAAATTMILLVSGVAGDQTVLSVLLAGLVALLVARTVGEFARRMVTSGSLYTYAAKGLGPVAAITTGAAILVAYAFVAIFALLGGAHYVLMLLQRVWPAAAGPGPTILVLLAEGIVLAVVLVRGIRLSTRLALVVEVISMAIIVSLLVVLVVTIGPLDVGAILPAAGLSPTALAAGTMLALTAFVGFESAATLGVEAHRPLRNIPRAIVWTVIVSGALYILAAYTQVAGFRALGLDLGGSGSPVNTLAARHGLDGWGVVIDVGIAASFLACAIASTTAFTRILFALGRDGVAPAVVGRTHPRLHTPIGAVLVAVPVVVVVPLAVVAAGVDAWPAMQAMIVVSAIGFIVAYGLVCVAAPVFLRRIGELTWRVGATAIAGAILLATGLAVYLVVEVLAGNGGVWVALALAVALGAAVAWRRLRMRRVASSIGAYDEPVAAQVLGGVAREADGD